VVDYYIQKLYDDLCDMKKKSKKLIVILGPTATGKTKLAVALAREFNGEIISADSRQVYRGMDIGTGKDLDDYVIKMTNDQFPITNKISNFKKITIPYYLIDIVSPKSDFNVAKYQKLAYRAIDDVLRHGKLPILVGGTGLYIDAVTKGYNFAAGQNKLRITNYELRIKLNELILSELLKQLKKIDPVTYNKIDKKNRRRVQRALEIYYSSGQKKSETDRMSPPDYQILFLGKTHPLPELYKRIDRRLEDRIKEGMIDEIKKLRRSGVSWKKMEEFGLEYRYVSRYARGLISYDDLVNQLKNAIHHFAKRQMTWFKRNQQIIWLKSDSQAERLIKKFLA